MPNGHAFRAASGGRMYVATIGIDRYRHWPLLRNAVNDATAAGHAFERLGFEHIGKPLLNEAATRDAIDRLARDELHRLNKTDSVVIYFAGHGHIETSGINTAYLIPVDAKKSDNTPGSWIDLSVWLRQLSNLPAKHVLVILDACHSGRMLDPLMRWFQASDVQLAMPLDALWERKSRRVMASARDNQSALDGIHGSDHSPFTECLLEGLTGGIAHSLKQSRITGMDIWSHIQTRFRQRTDLRQTPNFGAFEHHDHGDLVVTLPGIAPAAPGTWPDRDTARRLDRLRHRYRARSISRRGDDVSVPPSLVATEHTEAIDTKFFAALDHQDRERKLRVDVLSVIAGEADAARSGWARWSARRGALTLVTEASRLDDAIADLLQQLPWVRCLPAAQARLAAAAGIDARAIDAAFAARNGAELQRWITNVSGIDRHARVSGWLLTALRDPSARIPELTTAPAKSGELLSILCDLTTPISILFHHIDPSETWFEQAVPVAAALAKLLPHHPIAIAAPPAVATQVLGAKRSLASMSMARQGLVQIAATPAVPRATTDVAKEILFDAIAADRRIAGMFALDTRVPIHDDPGHAEVDVMGKTVRIAVQLDNWRDVGDRQRYYLARAKDHALRRAGFYVMRFLAEDVERRLAQMVDELAGGIACRRAARSPWETFR